MDLLSSNESVSLNFLPVNSQNVLEDLINDSKLTNLDGQIGHSDSIEVAQQQKDDVTGILSETANLNICPLQQVITKVKK